MHHYEEESGHPLQERCAYRVLKLYTLGGILNFASRHKYRWKCEYHEGEKGNGERRESAND